MKKARITNRQKQIVKLIFNDFTNKEIADSLNISQNTVDTHISNIRKVCNVKTKAGILKPCLQNKWLSIDELLK